ncbi:hypothetical protein O9993_09420 [Vibrio lentus]|nr:hypothetical protein [Vibrio lentus]
MVKRILRFVVAINLRRQTYRVPSTSVEMVLCAHKAYRATDYRKTILAATSFIAMKERPRHLRGMNGSTTRCRNAGCISVIQCSGSHFETLRSGCGIAVMPRGICGEDEDLISDFSFVGLANACLGFGAPRYV